MLPIAPDTLLQQRYRILNILEEGGLVRTYLATDRQYPDAYYSIEELTPFSQFSSAVVKAKELFKHEATLLERLDLPQLPRFWTTFEEQNRLFLVRDYIQGKTYGQILAEHRDLGTVLSESEVWQLLLKILPAIGYIHTQGVIHRDICPEHIVRRQSDGLPVLIDFGIVKEFANQLQAVPFNGGVSVGRTGYVPSEQIHGGRVYPHSDLYALAVTAIVLLTGKEPSALFENERMNWDWRRWTQIDDRFANCLSKMLSPNPEDRYQSAAEVESDLRAVASPTPQPIDLPPIVPNRLSAVPTVAVGGKVPPAADGAQTAITNLERKSIWEKPQVFIPVGILISLLAGFGSWFGVSQLLHRESSDPVATTPPKQIDFNNPTIPTDTTNPSPTNSDAIQPEMDRPIFREGMVSTENSVKYRVAALAGQNLDIQLVFAGSQTSSAPSTSTASTTNPATSLSSPSASMSPSPSTTNDAQSQNPPISVPTMAATQVLMTILTPTGSPIDSQADRVVGWRGSVPTTGEYTIELRPIQGLKGNAFPYKLSVTQIAAIPSPTSTVPSTPIPDATAIPDATVTPAVPVPDDSSGIDPTPNTSPSTTQPTDDGLPSSFPAPIPSVSTSPSPTETLSPRRNRRRNRTESSTSSTTRQRIRNNESNEGATSTRRRRRNRVVESSDESTATSTPRRRRNRVESGNQTTSTSTTRRRRNRTTQATPESSSSTTNSGNTQPSNTPSPEPSVGIPVPPAKTNTSPNSGVTDTE
ncbi:serine/threonine-protein kinase [Chamaesiphon minutus]|uniref:non-specific serine/threonine protein kinase n=1 Tax=Chamaesiphon minutus (strain ATCC 27169 / PCC 6605) TaxID=1173020 RepID=K9UJJ0_CHAP6|nr:serine/threonine-protein kinase [Chamaesiphon minutus]AFY94359.1 serine/threonine protein kinase [Chamaesiphon minutus PCC 6605]